MFALVYGAAATTCELASLDLADWDPNIPSLHLGRGYRSRASFQDRTIELGLQTADPLAGWVCPRGREPGCLFYSLDRYGAIKNERITGATVHAALRQQCDRAALPHIAPEDLRRTGLIDLLTSGADLLSVSDIAGNQSTQQTQRYLLPDVEAGSSMPHGETFLHK